jgi:1-deoxy-D-xylulose-5-phosphate synthase
MLETAVETAELLSKKKIGAAVVNARFIKPIDEAMISDICRSTGKVVTLEDGVLEGGFGSAVLETIERLSIKGVKVRRFGLPDRFIEHGRRSELFSKYNLTPQSICDVIIREVI